MKRFAPVWILLFCFLSVVAFEGIAPLAAFAAETANAKDSGGDGFELSTAIEIIGSIAIPSLTFGAGVVTDRRINKRKQNQEQLAFADAFLASSGKVVDRLQTFAVGSDRADDIAPLVKDLREVSEASTRIEDAEVTRLGQGFFDNAGAVLRAVGSPEKSTQPAAMEAVRAFDQLRQGVGRFRRQLSEKRRWGRGESSEANIAASGQRSEKKSSSPSGETAA